MDLVYLDPPFNSKKQWNAPLGSKAAGAGFKDTWTLSDIDLEWHDQLAVTNPALYDVIRAARGAGGDSTMSYLLMMSVRLLELRRVLKETGSIYLHCDPTESHSLKLMMDAIWGRDNFRNEIVWRRAGGAGKGSQHAPKRFGPDTDSLLFYSNSKKVSLVDCYLPLPEDELDELFPLVEEGTGRRYHPNKNIFNRPSHGDRPNLCYTYNGVTNPHPSGWAVSKERLEELDKQGAIIWRPGKRPQRKAYADEYKGRPLTNLWADISISGGKERVGYPTQKPVKLLERVILASSNEGDVVLDPFVGCATTPIAAEKHGRQWLGIDYSEKAIELVEHRLAEQLGLASSLAIHRTDIPRRTDLGDLPHYKTHKTALYVEQEGTCNLCLVWFEAANLSVDHIVPRKKGGTDHKDNLQLLCRACNSRKGDRTWESIKADYFKGRRQR